MKLKLDRYGNSLTSGHARFSKQSDKYMENRRDELVQFGNLQSKKEAAIIIADELHLKYSSVAGRLNKIDTSTEKTPPVTKPQFYAPGLEKDKVIIFNPECTKFKIVARGSEEHLKGWIEALEDPKPETPDPVDLMLDLDQEEPPYDDIPGFSKQEDMSRWNDRINMLAKVRGRTGVDPADQFTARLDELISFCYKEFFETSKKESYNHNLN